MRKSTTQTKIMPIGDFTFDSGETIPNVQIAYETYGTLNAEKDNTLVLYHALTGNQHAAGWCDHVPEAGSFWKPELYQGWWDMMIGPGKPLDTNEFFIICINFIGGCFGSTGPSSIAPDGKPWGSRFPRITARDQAHAQVTLLKCLGISHARIVAGSLGGFCAIVSAALYPDHVSGLILIGVDYQVDAAQRMMLFEQIMAVELDEKFKGGDYDLDDPPLRGLTLARIISQKLFVDQEKLAQRARKGTVDQTDMLTWYEASRNTESYMLHQGAKFARRFDANSYLRIVDMWITFDLATQSGKGSVDACFEDFAKNRVPVLLFSIDTDYCFTAKSVEGYYQRLVRNGVNARHVQIISDKGHDSFLLEPELYNTAIKYFLLDTRHPKIKETPIKE